MTSLAASYIRHRKSYAKIDSSIDLPYLVELQTASYRAFLQKDISIEQKKNIGLEQVFQSVFPIENFTGSASVKYLRYTIENSKYSVDECRQRGMTYAAPLKVVIQLLIWEVDKENDLKNIKDIKEQEVYFGEIPLMTERGTFIINGIERVVVSQLHRASGVFFDYDKTKTALTGKPFYTARIIPYRGSWLDFEFDSKDILYVRIDRRRKIHVSILLKALGYDEKTLLNYFYDQEKIEIQNRKLKRKINTAHILNQVSPSDIIDPKTGKIVIKKGEKITKRYIKKINELEIQYIEISPQDLEGAILAQDVKDPEENLLISTNVELSEEQIQSLFDHSIKEIYILFVDKEKIDFSFRNTMLADKVDTKEGALLEIYKRLRPGEPPTPEAANHLFKNLFFNIDRYDLDIVGRLKLNERLSLDVDKEKTVLTHEDILRTVHILLQLKVGYGSVDDIDNLANRRVRAVGELIENQYRIGLLRIDRTIKERLQLSDVESYLPHDVVNNKPVSVIIREFFGTSQLSQFMDQTNPLSEITHKRRLSSLGPGGLNRERAGFEVRDVHPTHYGRICPIETPEGPNIGLISSLATYARVNSYGFIETPYKNIKSNSIKYYSAAEEKKTFSLIQALPRDHNANDTNSFIVTRRGGEIETIPFQDVDLVDVASEQLVSVASSLIPFLQNDDANRALMGSNMMRQAVPLLRAHAPLVGTGMEKTVAQDSGASIVAKRDGQVEFVDATRIVVKTQDTKITETEVGADVDIYSLGKYQRSNIDTCINQKSLVNRLEFVKKGDIIADGFATEMGELALGQNVTVAFMPWNGYNFEDSILVSEKMIKEDLYTSIHIHEFECIARDTKLGQEEITSDIPAVSEDALLNLDESGIVRIGAEVNSNDLLVGKVTPKGEIQLTSEEKLLRAIFGEKASDVKDTSLRVPPGVKGTVIGVQIFSREGAEKDSRHLNIEELKIAHIKSDEAVKINIIKQSAINKIFEFIKDEEILSDIIDRKNSILFTKGTILSKENLLQLDYFLWDRINIKKVDKNKNLSEIIISFKEKVSHIRQTISEQIQNLKKGDQLVPGVIKLVKVYLAIKRKLSIGDKMAGRHGNKGVVSQILSEEDMPFLEDGTPVDIVLNPLGVPSRMNIGQILETHLGWGMKNLGEQLNKMIEKKSPKEEVMNFIRKIWDNFHSEKLIESFLESATEEDIQSFASKYKSGVHVSCPVFDGANEKEIEEALKLAAIPSDGKVTLFDGRTGAQFKERVTVGVMYVLKLHHLVDEKIHARSIGPYSLVTQQPLGGKAQFGGQRLGEMEVWAMEAYGAAYTLQEFLTVKADDVLGRTRMYESIVKGKNLMSPGLPESFNVLLKELQSLGLNIQLQKDKNIDREEKLETDNQ